MKLTRVQEFGSRRRTYFCGVAGFVLAAHVVVGGIVYVTPQTPGEAPPQVEALQTRVVDDPTGDRLIGGIATERHESLPALTFDPFWEPRTVSLASEPVGPTVSDLPVLVEVEQAKAPTPRRPSRTKIQSAPRRKARKVIEPRPEPIEIKTVPKAIPVTTTPTQRTGIFDKIRQRRERKN